MQIAIGLYPGFTALDAIGPYQVLTQIPGTEVVLCAEQTGDLADDNGLLHLDISHTFDDVPSPDLLLVPGGLITRRIAAEGGPIVEWIRTAHETTTWTTSVCTGALLLGAAGVLDGLRATTHWMAYDHLRSYGAEPTEERVVIEGKVVTGAGVSAGIDLALTLVGMMHGEVIAQAVQLGIEYDPQPPFDAGSPSKAPKDVLDLVVAVQTEAESRLFAS
ncbi:MAG: transcriptional regulator containing an amidase domain and an AraC-type DNA-binding domain [Acidimicrobiales bacterium]|nr:transcriptional regulator containing an amidase domain and an AraC-type DNA-binding domain [Acidimicrobiales bacterium]